jgi:hypothetical protein
MLKAGHRSCATFAPGLHPDRSKRLWWHGAVQSCLAQRRRRCAGWSARSAACMPASMPSERKSSSKVQPTIIHPSACRASRDIHFLLDPCHSRVRRRTRPPSGRAHARGVWACARPLGAFVRPPQREREGQRRMNAFCGIGDGPVHPSVWYFFDLRTLTPV